MQVVILENIFPEFKGTEEEKKTLLKRLKENEPERIMKNQNMRQDVINKLHNLRAESNLAYMTAHNNILSVKYLLMLIVENNMTETQEDMEQLARIIFNELNKSVRKVLAEKSRESIQAIKKYIENFDSINYEPINNLKLINNNTPNKVLKVNQTGCFINMKNVRIAKKMIKHFDKKKVTEGMKEVIKQFWAESEKEFNKSADKLEDAYLEHIKNLEMHS
jgi:hypothetical protein